MFQLKKIIPKKIRHILSAIAGYYPGIIQYMRHSNHYYPLITEQKYNSRLAIAYHIIEKGLTMPDTRLGFGASNAVPKLIQLCDGYKERFTTNSFEYTYSIRILQEYINFHQENNFSLDNNLSVEINRVIKESEECEASKQNMFSKQFFYQDRKASFDIFCKSRHSVRNYTQKKIPLSILEECIKLANHSPSACNRQPNRTYIINNSEIISKVLSLQDGNRGFGELAQTVLVITSDISSFGSLKERNEPMLNAGLFSMTLAYALHYYEIGSCFLNWSVSEENDEALHNLIKIPDNERIALLMTCGYPPDNFKVAASPRITTDKIMRIID